MVVAGNSLGGYNSLSLASAAPELVSGVVLLNGAGKFEDLDESSAQQSRDTVELDPLQAPGCANRPRATRSDAPSCVGAMTVHANCTARALSKQRP